jgi:hypothetical protein
MEQIIPKEPLFEGLNPDGQRRLYFLLLVADQMEMREAFALAERMETFITARAASLVGVPILSADAGAATSRGEGACAVENGNGVQGATSSADAPPAFDEAVQASPAPQRRLDRSAQMEFFKAIARGATNAELAERFGLTKRQAHALRIGMVRRSRSVEPASRTERQAPPATVEAEIIRFLRQVGDVVLKEDDAFVVNSILRLNFQELVARANTKRLQRGKPTFEFPRPDTPRIAPVANGAGAGVSGGYS